jgi:hypothetical protein
MLPSPMLTLYMRARGFDDKAFPWCIIEHKVLNKPQNPPLIMFNAYYSSKFHKLRINSEKAMSLNILLEEFLNIKNNM